MRLSFIFTLGYWWNAWSLPIDVWLNMLIMLCWNTSSLMLTNIYLKNIFASGHQVVFLMLPGNTQFAAAGCCFIKYATSEEADRAIHALHNQYTLPGVSTFCISFIWYNLLVNILVILVKVQSIIICNFVQGLGPIQVRYADGERERLGNLLLQIWVSI